MAEPTHDVEKRMAKDLLDELLTLEVAKSMFMGLDCEQIQARQRGKRKEDPSVEYAGMLVERATHQFDTTWRAIEHWARRSAHVMYTVDPDTAMHWLEDRLGVKRE